MRRYKGFTLIELLVVISIIALLLSILMPALTLAKQQAEYMICKSQEHSVYMAIKLYAEDNDGKIAGGPCYTVAYAPYIDEGFKGPDNNKYGRGPYINEFMEDNNYPYTCISAEKREKLPDDPGARFTFAVNESIPWSLVEGYSTKPADVNGAAGDTSPIGLALGPGILDSIDKPLSSSDTLLMSDTGGYQWRGEDGTVQYWQAVGGRGDRMPRFLHFGKEEREVIPGSFRTLLFVDGRVNALFFDGHVESIKTNKWIMLPNSNPIYREELGMTTSGSSSFWYGGLQ